MPLQFYVDSSGPDWAIHCCLVDFLKPVATISLAENSNVVGQLLKRGYLSGENCPVNFWATFLSTLGDFFFYCRYLCPVFGRLFTQVNFSHGWQSIFTKSQRRLRDQSDENVPWNWKDKKSYLIGQCFL